MIQNVPVNYRSDADRPLHKVDARGYFAETDLTEWAEQSVIAANKKPDAAHWGALVFWIVIAGLLIARYTLIDPAKLRPQAGSIPAAVSSVAR